MKSKVMRIGWAVLAILLLVPFNSVTVPEWTVQFVDAKGQPIVNLPVEQTWQNYSFEGHAHYENSVTDKSGKVTFPERPVWSPGLFRLLGPIKSLLGAGVHASFGPSSWLTAKCDTIEQGKESTAYTGARLPSIIQLGYFDRSEIRKTMPGSMQPPTQCKQIEQQVREAGF